MDYPYGQHYSFPIPQPQQHGIFHGQQLHFAGYQHQLVQQQQLPTHQVARYADFSDGLYYADFDDGNETTTRPRLTKEQVDVLEGEFQRNAKPNSGTKRHLAQVTSLNLPRVAVSHVLSSHFLYHINLISELVSEPESKGQTATQARRVREFSTEACLGLVPA